MKTKLEEIQIISMDLYKEYKSGEISENEYLEDIRPLDKEIAKIEVCQIKSHLLGHFVCEKSSLQQLR